MDTRTKVREVVASLLKRRGDLAPFADSDPLLTSGRLESLAVMELAAFLEQQFNVDLAGLGIDQSDFDSVDTIVAAATRDRRAS